MFWGFEGYLEIKKKGSYKSSKNLNNRDINMHLDI